jgi:hypothetical protein
MTRSNLQFLLAFAFATSCTLSSSAQDYTVTTAPLGFTSISTTGTDVGPSFTPTNSFSGRDDGFQVLPLPFDFTFFGVPRIAGTDTLTLFANGFVTFTQFSVTPLPFNLPDSLELEGPDDSIMFAWSDLDGTAMGAGSFFTQLSGTVGSRTFIIEYQRIPEFTFSPPTTTIANAQLVLHEGSNVIEFRYNSPNNFGAQSFFFTGLKGVVGASTVVRGPNPANSALSATIPTTTPTMNVIFTPFLGNPDISLSNLVISTPMTPGQALIGDMITVSVDVSNLSGTVNSTNFPVSVFLSLDSTIDTNDQLIGNFTGGALVNAGGLVSLSQSFTIPTPNPAASGRGYFIGVIADPMNTQADPSLQNNIANTSLQIGLPFYNVTTQPRGTFTSIVGMAGTTPLRDSANGEFDDELVNHPTGLPFGISFFAVSSPVGAPLQLSSNGYLAFNGGSGTSTGIGNAPFPNTAVPNNMIAFFWDDLVGRTAAAALISDRVDGTAPNRTWTIEYTNMEFFSGTGRFSCQIVIAETTNTVLLRYTEVTPVSGVTASVGLENVFGNDAVDGTGLNDGNSVLPTTDLLFTPTAAMAPPFIDLVASSISAAQTLATINGGLDVTRSITNTGNAATGSFQVSYYLSTNNFISISDTLIGTETVASVAAGQTFTMTSRFTIPGTLLAGTYFVGMIVNDGTPPLVEASTGNNTIPSLGTTNVVVGSGVTGDLNNDGLLDIGDIMSCVDAILNRPNDLNADFNADGNVNVLDLQIAINRVLGIP